MGGGGRETAPEGGPSMDQLLSSSSGDLPFDEAAAAEAKLLTFGKDTLISPRERANVVAAFRSPLAERQPQHLNRICDVLLRTKLGEGTKTEVVQALARTVQLVSCGKGRPVVVENESGEHMYLLISGQCVVEKADRAPSPPDHAAAMPSPWRFPTGAMSRRPAMCSIPPVMWH